MNLSWHSAVHHDSSNHYLTFEHLRVGTKVTVRLRAALDAPIDQIMLRTCPDGEQSLTPMKQTIKNSVCQWWETEMIVSMPRFNYRFLLFTSEGKWWLTANGLTHFTPTDHTDFKLVANQFSPKWINNNVFYQIFPDRFAQSETATRIDKVEYANSKTYLGRWGELPRVYKETGNMEFFCGDLKGIVDRLDYLQELGVTGLYLNPIFTAPSNHRYNTADFDNVDPHLGGNDALIELRQALDHCDMRLMLDIVLNHCGSAHKWFIDAQADRHAPTAEFFTFDKHPNKYASWLGISSLPKLNYRSERLRETIYSGKEAILRKWLRAPYRIDGWRIDVANMLARQGEIQFGHKIGRAIRRAIKEEFPQAYILGEHFFDGTPHLQGDELDATMNYRGFTFPLLQWLSGYDIDNESGNKRSPLLSSEALIAQWRAFIAAIPWQLALQQFNLLGSHDIPRIFTNLDENNLLTRVAAVLLFTYPGVPSIYYGDEIGMCGGRDPDNRRCMNWDRNSWHSDLFSDYHRLISLRKSSNALSHGGIQFLQSSSNTIAYLREYADKQRVERTIVVARRADDGLKSLAVWPGAIANGTRWREYFTNTVTVVINGRLSLQGLNEIGAQIWQEI